MQAARQHGTVTGTGTKACGMRTRTAPDGVSHPAESMKLVRS